MTSPFGANAIYASGGAGDPATFGAPTGGSGGAQGPRKKRLIDQIMAQRQMAGQSQQQFRMGGPEYMDWLQQLQMNPFATFY